MIKTLKDQYTESDLDALAPEEKQAWLEIRNEKENAASAGIGGVTGQARPPDERAPGNELHPFIFLGWRRLVCLNCLTEDDTHSR